MYVRCNECGWDSGDFGYNTFSYKIKSAFEFLILTNNKKPNDLWTKNKYFGVYWLKPQFKNAYTEFKYGVQNFIDNKKGIRPKTYDEFINKNKKKCPLCKSKNINID